MVEVWKMLLEVTESMATERVKLTDDVWEKLANEAKNYKKEKEAIFKRVSVSDIRSCIHMCVCVISSQTHSCIPVGKNFTV